MTDGTVRSFPRVDAGVGIARRSRRVSASKTLAMKQRAQARAASGDRIFDLTTGELRFAPPDAVRAAAMDAVRQPYASSTGTLGLSRLRKTIAAMVSERTDTDWSEAMIGLTAGAKQALFNVISTLIDPGDEVVIPVPYWTSFPEQVILAGGEPVLVDTRDDGYRLREKALVAALSPSTKVILVNTPNNPTGAVLTPESVAALTQVAVDNGIWLVFDEVYADYQFDRRPRGYPFTTVAGADRHVVLVNSFSKSLALPGWRLGYLAGPPALMQAVDAFQSHTTSNPNSLAQFAVLGGLRAGVRAYQDAILDTLEARRDWALDVLATVPGLHVVRPEGGFFLYADVTRLCRRRNGRESMTSTALAEAVLDRTGVAVVPGSAFGDDCAVRISFCGGDDEFHQGLARFAGFMGDL